MRMAMSNTNNHIKVLSELFVPQSKPNRSSRNKKDDPYDNIGQKLVGLVAAKLEDTHKDMNSSNNSKEQHIIDILHQLEIMIRRRGLFWDQSAWIVSPNDVDELMVMDHSNQRHGTKRQKMQPKLSSQEITSNEELILLGITRILNSNNQHTNNLSPFSVEASATVILALANDITTTTTTSFGNNSKKTCMQLELIAKYTSQWISSLTNHLEFLFQQMVGTTTTFYFGVPTTYEANYTNLFVATEVCWTSSAIVCLNAISSLVTYVGLPRVAKIVSVQVLQKLKSTAWRILGCLCTMTDETSLLLSTSKLIVCLSPISITSNTNKLVFVSWYECFLQILSEIALVLYRAYPPTFVRGTYTLDWAEKHCDSRQPLDDFIPQENQWLNNLASAIPLQDERATAIYHRVYALSHLLISYINYGEGGSTVIHFPLTSILDTCELLLKFGAGAENRYFNHKSTKANFNIPDENALLSLKHTIEIMNDLRFLGHSIFVSSLTAIGPTLMLPHAKRIASLVEVALLSCCSLPIQQLVRSTSTTKVAPANTNSNSIALRAKAIQTAKVSMLTLGSGATPMLSKSMQLIAGSLLEQMIIDDKSDCSWGSHSERENLIKESLEALSAFVCVGGRVLPLLLRSKLEEVVRSCLDKVIVTRGTTVCSEIKVAFLKLGMDIVSNPWMDGGISNLLPDFVQMGKLLQRDRDPNVVSMAFSLLNICNSIATPRSIPLLSVANRATNTLSSLEEELRINIERKQRREKPSQTLAASGQQENSPSTTFVISQNEKEQKLAESNLAASQTHTSDVKHRSEDVKSISAHEGTIFAPTNVAVDNMAQLERIPLSKDSDINNSEFVDSMNPLSVSHEAETEDPLHDGDNYTSIDSENKAMGYRSEKTILNSTNKHDSFSRKIGNQEEEEDEDEDYFPEIIDCGPDEGD